MALDPKYLKASDGTGSAVLAHITTNRLPGATTLKIDNVDNWPPFFIATSGVLASNGYITEASKKEFRAHLSGADIIIDSFEPGFTDTGNTNTEVVIIKQTTGWADGVADNVLQQNTDIANFVTANADWRTNLPAISSIVANGNRNYTVTFASTVAGLLSPKNRLRTTRSILAPTQSTLLNGTNQFFNRTTTISGMTFTDDFVAGAWIKVSSYQDANIISRYNGTSGWQFRLISTGQVQIIGRNGGAGNNSYMNSVQSVPLNKWVHVSAQLDMSAFTTTPTTSYVMIDGADVPVTIARGGTNPTAIVQAGNLEVGSTNGGSELFPGKIAQTFVSSAKITQANVRNIISQGLTLSVINANAIVSAYSMSNDFTDLNTGNANNLTAQNGATATNADAPFGGQADRTISNTLDYGIVQTISGSVANVQVAEGCAFPTTGSATAAYSVADSPLGFPGQKERWRVSSISLTEQSSPNVTSWTNIGSAILELPIGSWLLGYEGATFANRSVAAQLNVYMTLSTSPTAASDGLFTTNAGGASNVFSISGYANREHGVDVSTATKYYLNRRANTANDNVYNNSSETPSLIYADNAYL